MRWIQTQEYHIMIVLTEYHKSDIYASHFSLCVLPGLVIGHKLIKGQRCGFSSKISCSAASVISGQALSEWH